MTKPPSYEPVSYVDTDDSHPNRPLDRYEIEVQLAIAQFVIPRVAGTPAGQEIFDALLPRFEDRLFYHKHLTHYLIRPEHIETELQEDDDYTVDD
ncbi:hypothetical protein [Pseudomonas sp. MWU16-30317]|uniref:hypothetical protein n=1 Tax=Pseudomonas sp. MWU16-30317 TaxID=2878095 RepID=UPI001CFABF0F|nr:hypothetical protein [Pseudomonas sp. MWU16-30317]